MLDQERKKNYASEKAREETRLCTLAFCTLPVPATFSNCTGSPPHPVNPENTCRSKPKTLSDIAPNPRFWSLHKSLPQIIKRKTLLELTVKTSSCQREGNFMPLHILCLMFPVSYSRGYTPIYGTGVPSMSQSLLETLEKQRRQTRALLP